MKFTKLTSSVLAGATLLSILAPTATFAATSTAGSQGPTDDNNGTPLPMTDKTVAGISFGDNTDNGNTGFLRLQMVPHVLDFGNHKILDNSKRDFTADGKNTNLDSNNMKASFDNTDANQTKILNTNDKDLQDVKNTAWATVVDKQVTRQMATPSQYHADTDNHAGLWTLSVKSDDALQRVDNQGNKMGTPVTGAKLAFNNTKSGLTQEVYGLTGEGQDATYTADVAALTTAPSPAKPAGTIEKTISTTLAAGGTDQTVAKAAADEGMGANVYGWLPSDIKLTMPQGFKVENGVYKANLTWTLTSDAAS
ncbi:MAG: WxL domain-containing protein [Bacillota bacterium]|nr:WxL domain-containing protein [Bacillota bacterium]